MAFELLAKPVGTADLLLFLYSRGPKGVSAILAETGMNNEKFYNAAERLKSLGLAYDYEEAGATHKFLMLTIEGENMAGNLAPTAAALAATVVSLEHELRRLNPADPRASVRQREILGILTDKEYEAGRWEASRTFANRLVEVARERGDRVGEIHARLALGRIAQRQDRHEDAIRELEAVVRSAEEIGVVLPVLESRYLIGSNLERRGRFDDARAAYESAWGSASRANNPLWAALARLGVARILGRQGCLQESLSLHLAVVGELEALEAVDDLPRAYASLGSTAYHIGHLEALTWNEKAIAAARRVSDSRMEAFALGNAAASWIDAREFRRAEVALRRALSIHEGLGDRSGVTGAELNLANLDAAQGRWSSAEEHFDRAEQLARETGNRFQEASALFNRGQMMKRRDRPSEARGPLLRARQLFKELGSAARAQRCEEELADLTG